MGGEQRPDTSWEGAPIGWSVVVIAVVVFGCSFMIGLGLIILASFVIRLLGG